MLVFQFLMIGVFALKQHALVCFFCLPLPMLTLIFYRTIRKRFDCSTRNLNLSLVKEIRTPEKEFLQVRRQMDRITYYSQGHSYLGCSQEDGVPVQ